MGGCCWKLSSLIFLKEMSIMDIEERPQVPEDPQSAACEDTQVALDDPQETSSEEPQESCEACQGAASGECQKTQGKSQEN
jgi:hypothetical protein